MANRQTTLLLKKSGVAGKVPTNLALGEVAMNFADVILYASGTTTNSILPIGWNRVAKTGDTMTGALTITAATNPLTLVGVQAVNDANVLSINSSGVVHTIPSSSLSGGSSTTLYSGDGTLAGNRVVNLSTNRLSFSSATQPNTLMLSGGSIGVGIVPTALFQIGTLNPVISLKQTTTNQEFKIRVGFNTGIGSSNWNLYDATNNKVRMLFSGSNFGVGNLTTVPTQSTIFGWGGPSGANLDMRPDPAQYDESNIECENSDYDGATWTGYGIAMQHSGSGTSYTVCGYTSKILSQLRFTANNNIIRVINQAALRFATSDVERMVIESGGTVGIGVTASTNQLHVSAATNPVRFVGLQAQNDANVLSVDSSGVVHMIPSTTLSGGGATLYTGNGSLSDNRVVNIGTNTLNFSSSTYPNAFHISDGCLNFSGALMPNGDAGVVGDILFSQGTGVAPIWSPFITTFTYTPALYKTTNVTIASASTANYMLVGNWIHVWGEFTMTASSTLAYTELGLELTGSICLTNSYDLAGTAVGIDSKPLDGQMGGYPMRILYDVPNSRALLLGYPGTTDDIIYSYHFSYHSC